jgi:hypothetical protein
MKSEFIRELEARKITRAIVRACAQNPTYRGPDADRREIERMTGWKARKWR